MKWFKRIARVSVGFCREAAIDHSPGLQPWVRQSKKCALKVAPDASVIAGLNAPLPKDAPRSPLSGRFTGGCLPRAKALGCYLRPFHGQQQPPPRTACHHKPRFLVNIRGIHLLWLGFALAAVGCREEMRNDSRLKPLQEDPFFADRNSSRPLVPNTVPRGEANNDDFFYQGEISGKLVRGFPGPITKQELERGRERFNIYCSVCHGPTGEGDGMIVQRGFPQPPSFHEQRLRDAPEGHFFHVITHGYGAMYPYADRITPGDRWAIIAYIRALQLSRNSSINDVPADQRARLNGP